MLTVKHDPSRTPNQGQFFVSLADLGLSRELKESNRLGYWCDEIHLRTILSAVQRSLDNAHSPPEPHPVQVCDTRLIPRVHPNSTCYRCKLPPTGDEGFVTDLIIPWGEVGVVWSDGQVRTYTGAAWDQVADHERRMARASG